VSELRRPYLLEMVKREVNNKTVDVIGRKLVENDLLSDDEIDQIIGKADLFEQVSRRIAVFESSAALLSKRQRSWIPATIGAFASLAVVAVLALTVINRNSVATKNPAVAHIQVPDAAPEVARPDVPPNPIVIKPSAGRAQISDDPGMRIERASYRRAGSRVPSIRPRPASYKPEEEFYPVAYTGDPAETAGGGRIIRVNLNRSALFALGVNMPLENDVATVKADLLIGNDGVTRAVRLVE
jgi:hypothetical protein